MGLFLPVKAFVISSAMLVIFLAVIHPAARADSQSRYDECKEQARKLSRYTGPVPAERKRSGGVLRGAVAGATAGAALGWITDSDRGDAAKKGAALGALIGAVKKAENEKKRRKNADRRRRYMRELDACMSEQN